MKTVVFWFRRDLRLDDNTGLTKALETGYPVLPLFIFDENICSDLSENDPRISFIYSQLSIINHELSAFGSSVLVLRGKPLSVFRQLVKQFDITAVHYNTDYEPYAVERDSSIAGFLDSQGVSCVSSKDQVIFAGNDILKQDGKPYTVFTPYKNKWLLSYNDIEIKIFGLPDRASFFPNRKKFPDLSDLGFTRSQIAVKPPQLSQLSKYADQHNYPGSDSTTYLGPHLRFGTISIRKIMSTLSLADQVFQNELIWREFFMQILFHFPDVVNQNFNSKYNGINWRNNESDFARWCNGETGYPLVDAGMRQLNQTGYMHNRVRMVAAGFLCKHLLIDWGWGEAYFAEKLLDYELASNNGNWQWAAGTGCDAAPYFRVFNPEIQQKKFDPEHIYVKRWVSDYGTASYPHPMVEHSFARIRAIKTFKQGIDSIAD